MIIRRWQASAVPTTAQLRMLLELEGLEPFEEVLAAGEKTVEHRHPFCEVRLIVEGELMFNVSGKQFVLRAGDRVEIPANTKHSHSTAGQTHCLSVCAHRAI